MRKATKTTPGGDGPTTTRTPTRRGGPDDPRDNNSDHGTVRVLNLDLKANDRESLDHGDSAAESPWGNARDIEGNGM